MHLKSEKLTYTGKIQPAVGQQDSKSGAILYPYLPSEELVEAVNLAIFLQRPLLLKGEPGCGKTKFAHALAYELNLPIESWHIKSTSRFRDGLYTYNAIGRLRDAQLISAGRMVNDEDIERIDNPSTYIQLGPIGRAFTNLERTVVLIDEIDKADIDFPNDLLLELDELRFFIDEAHQEVRAQAAPILIITSNDEKELSDAFLRRCLFHYVDFPDRDRLISIINLMFPKSSQVLVSQAVDSFNDLREKMQEDKGRVGKKVSTSELVDWFRVLCNQPQQEVLDRLILGIPFPGILLKNRDDLERYVIKEL